MPTEDGEDASAVAEPVRAHSIFNAEISAEPELDSDGDEIPTLVQNSDHSDSENEAESELSDDDVCDIDKFLERTEISDKEKNPLGNELNLRKDGTHGGGSGGAVSFRGSKETSDKDEFSGTDHRDDYKDASDEEKVRKKHGD